MQVVVPCKFLSNSLAQFYIARYMCIVAEIIVNGFFCGIFHYLRRIKIGLAEAQVNNIYPLRFEFPAAPGHGNGLRLRKTGKTRRKGWHISDLTFFRDLQSY